MAAYKVVHPHMPAPRPVTGKTAFHLMATSWLHAFGGLCRGAGDLSSHSLLVDKGAKELGTVLIGPSGVEHTSDSSNSPAPFSANGWSFWAFWSLIPHSAKQTP